MSYRKQRLNNSYRHALAAQQRASHALYCVTTLRSPLLAAAAAREAAHEATLAIASLNATERNILFASI